MFKNRTFTGYDFHDRIFRFFVFTGFFAIFFLYHKDIIYQNPVLFYAINTLTFVLFIVSVYNIKIGLYTFIFLIPLLNSLTIILGIRSVRTILFLFFSLFLGFLVNKTKDIENRLYPNKFDLYHENEIELAIFTFIIIVAISSAITIYRYLNFAPFLSTKYHDLIVNIESTGSTGSIQWTIKSFFNYIIGFGLLFIIFNTFKKIRDITETVIVIIASNVIVFIIGFYQYFFNPTFGSFTQWAEVNRINATFTDPNSLGNYLILMFPLYMILIIYYKKWYQKLLFAILLAAFLLITFFSGSRNAMLGIIVALGAFAIIGLTKLVKILVIKSRKSRKIRNFSIALASVVLIIVILFVSFFAVLMASHIELKDKYRPPETGIALFDRTVDTIWMSYNVYRQAGFIEAFKSVSSERYVIWAQAVNMFRDYKVTGLGLGSFIIELPNYYELNNASIRIVDYTGNYYLQILSELGLPGLLLILFIFFLIIKKVFYYFKNQKITGKKDKADWFLTGFFISFISMVILLFLGPHTNFNEIQFSFWLIIGLMLVFIRIKESEFSMPDRDNKFNSRDPEDYKYSLNIVRRFRLDMVQKISLILIIIIFFSSFLFSSITDLSINIRQNLVGWENDYGFYKEEPFEGNAIRWAGIDASEVIENPGGTLIIPVKDLDPAVHLLPLFIRFFIDNKLVKVVKISDKDWHDIKIDLSGYSKEKLTFTMACSRSWVPKERGLTNDTRELGIMTGIFEFPE
ncbi:MAG: O-antigen ligase family protein [Actinomycetota bacterium]